MLRVREVKKNAWEGGKDTSFESAPKVPENLGSTHESNLWDFRPDQCLPINSLTGTVKPSHSSFIVLSVMKTGLVRPAQIAEAN